MQCYTHESPWEKQDLTLKRLGREFELKSSKCLEAGTGFTNWHIGVVQSDRCLCFYTMLGPVICSGWPTHDRSMVHTGVDWMKNARSNVSWWFRCRRVIRTNNDPNKKGTCKWWHVQVYTQQRFRDRVPAAVMQLCFNIHEDPTRSIRVGRPQKRLLVCKLKLRPPQLTSAA